MEHGAAARTEGAGEEAARPAAGAVLEEAEVVAQIAQAAARPLPVEEAAESVAIPVAEGAAATQSQPSENTGSAAAPADTVVVEDREVAADTVAVADTLAAAGRDRAAPRQPPLSRAQRNPGTPTAKGAHRDRIAGRSS